MLVRGPQDVDQKGVATGRGELSLSSSNQGASAFLFIFPS
ncbi:hypothetical protein JOC86_002682 [Bacillus pakistanensis]|uniref:Uncharacterized protein n=1 Tax=Rossellomorea pakistanensis TaxID=992288 RepID=A0ABS2NE55_9BACI|nr:hypothetical protein [Bacillus pakistanensis]